MALAPISQLIEVKPRPQTTLQLLSAIGAPARTLTDYVFTPSIKENLRVIIENLRHGYGGGYWALSEYGGGKTHFLATLTSMLSAPDHALEYISDPEVRQGIQMVSKQRLFPVAFNLIGRGDMLNQNSALFRILEDELRKSAHNLLGVHIVLALHQEVKRWWDALGEGTRSDITKKYADLFARPPDDYEESPERWAKRLSQSAGQLGIGIDVASSPVDRLAAAYDQIVNQDTGYTGLLIVMDEFGSWQDQRREGDVAYSEDENLLQALAETLPRERGLNVFTLVASQKPMPRKFEGERFRQFDVLRPSEGSASPSLEYAMVVAARVRAISEYRSPEIEEYHEHYRSRFDFARGLTLDDFTAIFPMQPLCFDTLRRITSNLTTTRTGINVLWDVLAHDDQRQPEPRPNLANIRRLITAADLLDSDTLHQDLRQSVRYSAAYRAYEQAIELIERLVSRGQISQEDASTASDITRTLFLWHCSRDGHTPMSLDEISEAIVPEEGFLDSPKDVVLSILDSMADVPQIKYDAEKRELSFVAEIVMGRPAADVFSDYRAGFNDPVTLRTRWREFLTDSGMSSGFLSSILSGLEAGTPSKRVVTYKGINYEGEAIAATNWRAEWGGKLPFDNHFRLVFMLGDETDVTWDMLEDRRVLACIPAPLSEDNVDALKDLLALERMREDYALRQDDEALRVNQFVNSRRSSVRNALLMAQWDCYKRGRIASAQGIDLDANYLFGAEPDLFERMAESMFDVVFADRPIGKFSRNRNMNLNTDTNRVFTGLWDPEPERAVRSALENFAVGLGLARRDNPLTFDPSECGAFDIIRDLYAAAQESGGQLQAMTAYEKLAEVGIPARLATLYLLCFVRANADVELLLKSGHRIQLTDGGQLRENRIGSNTVSRIRWNARAFSTASYFDALTERRGPIWNDCLIWTRKFAPDLNAATSLERVEEETSRLTALLRTEGEHLSNAETQARTLQTGLSGGIPDSVERSIDIARRLTASTTLEQFMDAVESCGLSNPDGLENVVADVRNLHRLSQSAAEITAAHAYLEGVAANRFTGDLARIGEDRNSLLDALDLGSLTSDPDKWRSTKNQFDAWKIEYSREYRKSHRDFHVVASKLSKRIPQAEDNLDALENAERVRQIVQTDRAPELRDRLRAILSAQIECEPVIQPSDLESTPNCPSCGVRMGDMPQDYLSALEVQISDALNDLVATLRSDSIDKALTDSEIPVIVELREALSEYDIPRIVQTLKDSANAQLLETVIDGDGDILIVSDASVIDILSKEYPTVSQDSVVEVAERFRELMEETLRDRQSLAGPNVKVEIRLS